MRRGRRRDEKGDGEGRERECVCGDLGAETPLVPRAGERGQDDDADRVRRQQNDDEDGVRGEEAIGLGRPPELARHDHPDDGGKPGLHCEREPGDRTGPERAKAEEGGTRAHRRRSVRA